MNARIKLALLAAALGLLMVAALPTLAASTGPGTAAANAQVAIVHLAPFATGRATAVTVTIDASPVLTDVVYGHSTAYLPVPEGSHLVQIYRGSTATPAISTNVVVTGGQSFTLIAVGNDTYQPLALKLLEDDVTAPVSPTFKLRIGHLAPFSNTVPGTLADVRLQNGTPIVLNVPYGAVATSYTLLPAGTYDFKVTAPGGMPTLIDPFPTTFNPRSIVSLFLSGDGVHEPLGVFELPSGHQGHFLLVPKFKLRLPIMIR